MTHPKNLIRLKQALAHTSIVTGRAKAASELELMRAQSVLDQARLDRQGERTRRESEYLGEVEKLIAVEERKRAMVMAISDDSLREALARELGVENAAVSARHGPSVVELGTDADDQARQWFGTGLTFAQDDRHTSRNRHTVS
jgi:hypothetical protein